MPKQLWTVEQCREMGKRSAEARKQRKLNPPPEPTIAQLVHIPTDIPADEFTIGSIACVRAEIARLDAMLLQEKDAQALNWLATARGRLHDQEFDLSGKAKPGSRRPGPERSRPAAAQLPRPVPAPAPSPTPDPAPNNTIGGVPPAV